MDWEDGDCYFERDGRMRKMPLERTVFTIPVEIEKPEFDIKIKVDLDEELTIPDSIVKRHMAGLTKKEYKKWCDGDDDEDGDESWDDSITVFLYNYLDASNGHLISEDEALFLKDMVLLSYDPGVGGYPKETYCTFRDTESGNEFTIVSFFWDTGDKHHVPYMLAYKNEPLERTVIKNGKVKIIKKLKR